MSGLSPDSKEFFKQKKMNLDELEFRLEKVYNEKENNRFYTDDSVKDFRKLNKPKFPWIYPFCNPFLPQVKRVEKPKPKKYVFGCFHL